jgi:murein DD-endopeptidase MepM/ murein hydrolase activator NlpD
MKLQLFYPIKPMVISQQFGETSFLPYYEKNGVYFAGHNGVDLVAFHGQEVRASHDGVVEVQVDDKQGHGVVITTNDYFEYKGWSYRFKTIYWHLIDNIPVVSGQKVKAGDVIGYADSTGLSTGDHLHFGLKPLKLNGTNLEPNNGYQGAIDPTPYFIDEYAADIGKIKQEYFKNNLQRGDDNSDVLELQKMLQNLGYLTRADLLGIYGPRTQQAVYRFQQDFGVPLTLTDKIYQGKYFGPKTRKVANRLYPS